MLKDAHEFETLFYFPEKPRPPKRLFGIRRYLPAKPRVPKGYYKILWYFPAKPRVPKGLFDILRYLPAKPRLSLNHFRDSFGISSKAAGT
jgi:hypothetical protein